MRCTICGIKIGWLSNFCKLCDEEYNIHIGDFVKHKLTKDKGLVIYRDLNNQSSLWGVRLKDLSIKQFYDEELERM